MMRVAEHRINSGVAGFKQHDAYIHQRPLTHEKYVQRNEQFDVKKKYRLSGVTFL
jgi:hypothetical protein